MNEEEFSSTVMRFTWIDYMVTVLMLTVSAGIGIFFGCCGHKIKNTNDFLMAGRSMTTVPISLSLVASFMSAITLLGTPWEVYNNGIMFVMIVFAFMMVMPVTAYIYVPVYWNLQLTSVYEYLELRFHKSVRWLGSFISIIQILLFMSIAIYAPSLALSQVTGVDMHLSVVVMTVVCVFYTTLGGMKAVIWTDVLQVFVMFLSVLFVVVKGTIDVGGVGEVWATATEGNRTQLLNWDPNPTTRHTIWTLILGGYFNWICVYGSSQQQVQRYLSVKKRYMATRALWINAFALSSLVALSSYAGLVVYSKYELCDPIRSGLVSKGDQVLPLFVMDTFSHWQGIPGLFTAGILSGSLSSVSTGINSLATITLEDFILKIPCCSFSSSTTTHISRALTLIYGLLTLGLVFIIEKQGDVLAISYMVFGTTGGPLHGAFALGMFFPQANALGAFIGTVLSLVVTFWIGLGRLISVKEGHIIDIPKPTSVEGCNMTIISDESPYGHFHEEKSILVEIYKISYLYYGIIGTILVIVFGMLISALTGFRKTKTLDSRLLVFGSRVTKNKNSSTLL